MIKYRKTRITVGVVGLLLVLYGVLKLTVLPVETYIGVDLPVYDENLVLDCGTIPSPENPLAGTDGAWWCDTAHQLDRDGSLGFIVLGGFALVAGVTIFIPRRGRESSASPTTRGATG